MVIPSMPRGGEGRDLRQHQGCAHPYGYFGEQFDRIYFNRKCGMLPPSKSRLGIHPRDVSTHVLIILSFRKDFRSTCNVPGTVLGSGDTSAKKNRFKLLPF